MRVIQNCHHFHEHAHRTLGGRGSRAAVLFSKMLLMVHCDFERDSQNQYFQSTLGRQGGGYKKVYFVYTPEENVDNSERPLTQVFWQLA